VGHVARVLLRAGGVRDDEFPARGGEIAVGHIDGDALLALCAKTVGEQREVDGPVERFTRLFFTEASWSS